MIFGLRTFVKELEQTNKALMADLDRYSHEREMNADVACALKQRDDARTQLSAEHTAHAETKRQNEHARRFAETVLDKLDDRLWHAEDNTWWAKGSKGDLRLENAEPPSYVTQLEHQLASATNEAVRACAKKVCQKCAKGLPIVAFAAGMACHEPDESDSWLCKAWSLHIAFPSAFVESAAPPAKRASKCCPRCGEDHAGECAAKDACQICHGAKGGVPGNENLTDGIVMCDYCLVIHRKNAARCLCGGVGCNSCEPQGRG